MNSVPTTSYAGVPDVAIVGEINPDLIVYGVPEEMPAEREILATGCKMMLGSSSAILAHNLSLLGTKVSFSSRAGDDLFADVCLDEMTKAGVDISGVKRSDTGAGTGITVILPLTKNRRIVTYPGAMFEMSLEDLDLDQIARARHFHLSSVFLHKKMFADIPWLFQEMKRRGLSTSLDTNDDPDDRWQGVVDEILPYVDLFFGTEEELCKIAKVENPEQFIASRVPILVVKRGPRGASAFFENQSITAPGLSLEVVDTVGAGDTFDAGFLHQWLRKAPLETCLRFGNLAGGLSVTRSGGTAAFRDAAYRQSFLKEHWREHVLAPE